MTATHDGVESRLAYTQMCHGVSLSLNQSAWIIEQAAGHVNSTALEIAAGVAEWANYHFLFICCALARKW
jgi:hypothetical protein